MADWLVQNLDPDGLMLVDRQEEQKTSNFN